MTDPLDDLLVTLGITDQPNPAHWRPIARLGDFDEQQSATRAALAEHYQPGTTERSLVHICDPGLAATINWSTLLDQLIERAGDIATVIGRTAESILAAWQHLLDAEPGILTTYGIITATPAEPAQRTFDHLPPRERALARKNHTAREHGLNGTRRATQDHHRRRNHW